MKKLKFISFILTISLIVAGCASGPPLNKYIQRGNSKKSLKYIESGKDINLSDKSGLLPIHIAAKMGDVKVLNALLARGADIHVREYSLSASPIYYAAINNNQKAIRFLINNGANVNDSNRKGRTALKIACSSGKIETVRALIEAGANVDKMQLVSSTALMKAVNSKNLDIVNLLLNSGANINGRDNMGNTPLILSTYIDDEEIFKFLIDNGADTLAQNDEGQSAIIICAFTGNIYFTGLLIISGADVNALSKYGRSALHLSSIAENTEIINMLLDNGAKPVIVDLSEDDIFGTAYSHGFFGKRMLNRGYANEALSYLNIAVEYFEKAENEYRKIVKDINWKITKNVIKSVLITSFTVYAGQYQAQQGSFGYPMAPVPLHYGLPQPSSLSDVKKIYKIKKKKSTNLKAKYQALITKTIALSKAQ